MTELATALCRGPDLGTGQKAPDLVHLLPLGEIKGRDGRLFILDNPEGVVSASLSQGLDLVIDYEHQGDDPAIPRAGDAGRFRRPGGSRTWCSRPVASGAAWSGPSAPAT